MLTSTPLLITAIAICGLLVLLLFKLERLTNAIRHAERAARAAHVRIDQLVLSKEAADYRATPDIAQHFGLPDPRPPRHADRRKPEYWLNLPKNHGQPTGILGTICIESGCKKVASYSTGDKPGQPEYCRDHIEAAVERWKAKRNEEMTP
jgi:hypothetical protein